MIFIYLMEDSYVHRHVTLSKQYAPIPLIYLAVVFANLHDTDILSVKCQTM